MTLTTTIPGSPTELSTIASWLRGNLGLGLDDAGLTLQSVRQDDGGWDGTAGDAFRTQMSTTFTNAAGLNDAVVAGASGIDVFALALATAQSDMEAARAAATAAGLTVTATAIIAPSAVWPRPTPPVDGVSAAEVQSYYLANDRYAASVTAWQGYGAASAEVARISVALSSAADSLDDLRADVELVKVPVSSLLGTALVDGYVALLAPHLAGPGNHLLLSADRFEMQTRSPGAALHPHLFYKDLDDAAAYRARAAALPDHPARFASAGRAVSTGVGVALTGVAIWMDIRAGESTTQAVTSNLAGLTASIVAGATIGAAVGTLIPVPVLGTIVGYGAGALSGAAIGILTSGMVDSIFENGPDVMAAIEQGAQDLADTGAAIADLTRTGIKESANAVGDALDWAADGLSDAYDWAFG